MLPVRLNSPAKQHLAPHLTNHKPSIISQLASLLDLNSLHDLSLTCRQFRANLLQYRNQLVSRTLRCTNEDVTLSTRLADRIRESHRTWKDRGANSLHGGGRLTSGKVGRCARDMVGECRRCGTIVCRVRPPKTEFRCERQLRGKNVLGC